jgi:hypothetical protein
MLFPRFNPFLFFYSISRVSFLQTYPSRDNKPINKPETRTFIHSNGAGDISSGCGRLVEPSFPADLFRSESDYREGSIRFGTVLFRISSRVNEIATRLLSLLNGTSFSIKVLIPGKTVDNGNLRSFEGSRMPKVSSERSDDIF